MDPQYKKTNVLNKLDIKFKIKEHPYDLSLSLCK